MNELLTLNLKPGVSEASPNLCLKQSKNPLKGENFSSHLKSHMAKRDVAKSDEAKSDEAKEGKPPVKKEEKSDVKKPKQGIKTKDRRENTVSKKNKSDNNDNNTDAAHTAGVKDEKPPVDLHGVDEGFNANLDEQDNKESLDKFLEDYLNITEQGGLNTVLAMGEDTQGIPMKDNNSTSEMMMDLSALDMREDLPDNLFEGLIDKFAENQKDKSDDASDANQMDKLFDKLTQKAAVERSEQAKPDIEQTNKSEKTSDTPFIEALKAAPMEQNNALKTAQKDEQINAADSKTDSNNMAVNNLSMKAESGRYVSTLKPSPSTPDSSRVFFVNENKFIITKHGDNKVEVTLEPNGIGKLRIEINHEKGVIHTTISASEASGKEIIEKNINRIMEELSKEGINIGEFSVTLKERHEQSFDDSKREAHNDNKEIKDIKGHSDVTAPTRHINNNGRLSIFI